MRHLTVPLGIGLGIAALLTSASAVRAGGKSFKGQTAPEISCSDWMNRKPTTLAELKGQVVLLEFWSTG